MIILTQKRLFAWDCLEDHPTLVTIKELLETIPDATLLEGLNAARGKGRDDYPVRTLWGVAVLTAALRHTSFDACLGELGRNPTLAKLIGIESEEKIPKGWNVSRFLQRLGQRGHRPDLEAVFNGMAKRLGEVVPDLGRNTAADSTSLKARKLREDAEKDRQASEAGEGQAGVKEGKGVADGQTAGSSGDQAVGQNVAASGARTPASKASSEGSSRKIEEELRAPGQARRGEKARARATDRVKAKVEPQKQAARQVESEHTQASSQAKGAEDASHSSGDGKKIQYDKHGLPQPSGGRKEYKDDKGQVTLVYEWFGYKLHLLVDVKHEVVLAYRISSTKMGDNEVLPALVDQGKANLGNDRIKTLAYDKAADDIKVHQTLHASGIKPVIQNRSCWKDGETERLLPGHDGNSNIVYDEAGTLYCYDRVSDPMVRRPMAFIGHEKSRGTLKYRCPAMHDGFPCAMSHVCNAGKKYGLTVRVKQDIDLRRFPPIPRATKQFERLYKGRTSVERVNARMKIFWGADDGNVTGAARFFAMVGIVMVVHLAFATLLASLPRLDESKRKGTLGRMKLSPIAKALRERIAGTSKKADLPDWIIPSKPPSS